MTDEQLKAKKWDMLQEAKTLRGRRAALEDEVKKFAASWSRFGRECRDVNSWSFRVSDRDISVLNPSQSLTVIGSVPRQHFEWETIARLFTDLEDTKEALWELEKQLDNLV